MGLIFAVPGHIEQIKSGEKTQTRRLIAPRTALQEGKEGLELRVNGRLKYAVGRKYAVQPGRGKRGVGYIEIIHLRVEGEQVISVADALSEGRYRPEEYEALWKRMYPRRWDETRLVIEFKWVGEVKK